MDAGIRWGALFGITAVGFLLLGNFAPGSSPLPRRVNPPQFSGVAGTFPPAPAPLRLAAASRHGPSTPDLDRRIAGLGQQAPRYPSAARRDLADAADLMQFALARLPAALAGDSHSQYLIYLALDQCRSYLRLDEAGARVMLERIELQADALMHEELQSWRAEHARCRRFAGGDWSTLGEMLGPDQPGAETEYASVWFERAVAGGHPAALAEQAFRLGPLGGEERLALLHEALATRDPDIYWLLFAHSAEVQDGAVSAPALAWLIVSCLAGGDCREQARWYRSFICGEAGRGCQPGQSAVEYYWYAASPWEREQAWQLAQTIAGDLDAQRWQRLPLPELASRDSRRLERSLD